MDRDVNVLAPSWSALALRGIASVVFGIIAFVRPGVTLFALAIVFGAYAFVDGVAALAIALRRGPVPHRTLIVIDGLCGIAAGIITLLWPKITLLAILIVMGIRFIVTGGFELLTGLRLRRERASTRVLFVLGGLASLALGLITLALPVPTAVVLMWILGIYAFVFGVVMLVLSVGVKHGTHGVAPRMA